MIRNLFSLFQESSQNFEGQEAGETVHLLLRRHPFTVLLPLSFLCLFALGPIVILLAFSAQIESLGIYSFFLFLSSLYYLFMWVAIFYFLTLYSLNTVIITDRRIIDNNQHGFFNRLVSELHTYRVQDVTTHTHGVIETLMDFGDIVVQTAAVDKQFIFDRVAHPEEVKDKIMKIVAAHQAKVKLT